MGAKAFLTTSVEDVYCENKFTEWHKYETQHKQYIVNRRTKDLYFCLVEENLQLEVMLSLSLSLSLSVFVLMPMLFFSQRKY